MLYSEQLDKIAPALLRVQQKVAPVRRDAENTHFGNTYATLDSLIEYVRNVLAEEKLVLIQGGGESHNEGSISVETTLMHESGQWVKHSLDMPMAMRYDKEKNPLGFDPQAAGSAVTYGRRYGLASLLMLTTEVDDDGEAAVRRMRTVAEQTQHAPPRARQAPPQQQEQEKTAGYDVGCPQCGGPMWDNRANKKNPRAPDFKCKQKLRPCDGVIWPPKKKNTQQDALEQGPPDDGYRFDETREPDLPF